MSVDAANAPSSKFFFFQTMVVFLGIKMYCDTRLQIAFLEAIVVWLLDITDRVNVAMQNFSYKISKNLIEVHFFKKWRKTKWYVRMTDIRTNGVQELYIFVMKKKLLNRVRWRQGTITATLKRLILHTTTFRPGFPLQKLFWGSGKYLSSKVFE